MAPAQKQKHRSTEQDRKPRDKHTYLCQSIYHQGGKTIQWRKESSINGAENTRQLQAKE